MAEKITYGQLLHLTQNAAVESHATGVAGVNRLGVKAPDLEELIGEVVDTPTEHTLLARLKDIADALGATNQKDFATETTLAAILAKLIAAPATEAKQDTGNATLASILAKLADPASQTTLAAVLAQLQSGVTPVTLNGSLPAGNNLIGKVILNGTGAVSLNDAMIILPTDAQAVKKTKQFETTTALGASAVYTGATIDTSTERRVTGFVSADQAGTLTIESSTNGTNWYTVFTQEVTANTTYGFDVPCYSEYSRVKYTNGSTAQTAFRLVAYTLPI
jgi:hypothetical protein